MGHPKDSQFSSLVLPEPFFHNLGLKISGILYQVVLEYDRANRKDKKNQTVARKPGRSVYSGCRLTKTCPTEATPNHLFGEIHEVIFFGQAVKDII